MWAADRQYSRKKRVVGNNILRVIAKGKFEMKKKVSRKFLSFSILNQQYLNHTNTAAECLFKKKIERNTHEMWKVVRMNWNTYTWHLLLYSLELSSLSRLRSLSLSLSLSLLIFFIMLLNAKSEKKEDIHMLEINHQVMHTSWCKM